MSGPGKKINEIERLRGLAVIMVIVGHIHLLKPFVTPVLRQSWTGVDLFFVISGFVVSLSLLKYLPSFLPEDDLLTRFRSAAPALKKFFVRRTLRILPLAFFWAALPLGLGLFLNSSGTFGETTLYTSLSELVAVLTFQYNYAYIFEAIPRHLGYYWSLSVEEHFYMILPFFFIFIKSDSRRLTWSVLLALLCAFIIRPLISFDGPSEEAWAWIRFATHNRFDSLLAGVCLAFLYRGGVLESPVFDKKVLGSLVCCILLLFLWIVPGALESIDLAETQYIVFTILSFLLVLLASQQQGYVFDIPFVGTFLEKVGTRSYAIYLIHVPAEHIVYESFHRLGIEMREGVGVLVWVAVTLVLVEASHQLIERPLIKYARQLTTKGA